MLNIVIPMAGLGSRFAVAGYSDPKPLIPIHGIPMIRWVIANLSAQTELKFIFIAQKSHVEAYNLGALLSEWAPGSELVTVDGVTDGAARTVLKARDLINSADPMVIANSDQWIEVDIQEFYEHLTTSEGDGLIMTMKANDPKWSFIAKDSRGHVSNVVEKQVISDDATVGIYGFGRGSDFVRAATKMIESDFKVNGEYYVAPVYNELIAEGAIIESFEVGEESQGMYGLGIPADLELFENLEMSLALRTKLWK